MRAKVHWFRAEAAKSPREVAGALALVAWGSARRMVASIREAGFDLDPGDAYFDFLAEALAFEVQVAWRGAHGRYGDAQRFEFMNELAHSLARILAENRSDLLGVDAREAERRFVADLNRRIEEYGDFEYGAEGPSFAFLRYFASLLQPLVPEKDRRWIHDQVIAIEAPEAASAIAKGLDALLDAGPGRLRRPASGVHGE